MIKAFQFTAFARLRFQSGGIQFLGEEVKALGGKKVFLVTDPGVKKSGILERALKSLQKDGIPCAVFDEVEANPSSQTVEKGIWFI